MIGTLINAVFGSKLKMGLILVVVIAVGGYIGYLKYQLMDRETTIAKQQRDMAGMIADIEAAKATIAGFKVTTEMNQADTKSVNELLEQCYKRIAEYEENFALIDQNMEEGKNDVPLNQQEGEKYETITRAQQKSGAAYINNQFDALN